MSRRLRTCLVLLGIALGMLPDPGRSEAFFFLWDDDVPPPAVVKREAQLYREHTDCDYVAALRKYGRDIDARRACHGMLFP